MYANASVMCLIIHIPALQYARIVQKLGFPVTFKVGMLAPSSSSFTACSVTAGSVLLKTVLRRFVVSSVEWVTSRGFQSMFSLCPLHGAFKSYWIV
jgi:hypothetical protein